jgi:hypothetical protein
MNPVKIRAALLAAVGSLALCLPANAGKFPDCNNNGVPDDEDIANGTSVDCNFNGIPDECDVDPDDPDGNGEVSADCNNDGVPDECLQCPPLDVVFVMDTSGSMDDEGEALCSEIEQVAADLDAIGIEINAEFLGITQLDFSCLTDTVENRFGTDVPGDPPCCPLLGNQEDWGPATAIVAANYPWTPGAVRVIVPLSDEGARDGDPCDDPGSDRQVIENAIVIANQYDVIVSPISGTGSSDCVIGLAEDLAMGTGGMNFISTDPDSDLAEFIFELVLSACETANDCNDNGVPDDCDIDPTDPDGNGEVSPDCNLNGIPDECDIADGTSEDANGDGIPDECGENCYIPGRFDPATNEYVLRGFIVAFPVNSLGKEIRWNHLSGVVSIVNYTYATAWQYNAWAFQSVDQNVQHGEETGTPGTLNLDGDEFAPAFGQLLYNFQAVGSSGFSGPTLVVSNGDLTLHPVSLDVRQETEGPVTTKAHIDVWNENELKLSGAFRCVTCWDQTLLSDYGVPNHFLIQTLQTDHGKARIDGVASQECEGSVDSALLGVAAKMLSFDLGASFDNAGANLVGLGTENAVIQYDIVGPPPENPGGKDRNDGMIAGFPQPQDRVSGTEKGSVLYFSKVEIRYDIAGNLVQDSFVCLTNDYPDEVDVKMYFVNGDPPIAPNPDEGICGHPGWNWLNNAIELTANQPTYWSVATGQPEGVSPFWVLDPGDGQ